MPEHKFTDDLTPLDRDPEGHRYPWIESIEDDAGARTRSQGRQPLGVTLDTGRLLLPGDRVIFRCEGFDPHGRELRWWVHPFGSKPAPVIRGDRVELTWVVEPVSAGPRVYVGIGMAAQSRHHRQGGLGRQGYDGWIMYYCQVAPAHLPIRPSDNLGEYHKLTYPPCRSPKRSLLVQHRSLSGGRPW